LDKNWKGLIPEAKQMAAQLNALWKAAVQWGWDNSLFPETRDKFLAGQQKPKTFGRPGGGGMGFLDANVDVQARELEKLRLEQERLAKEEEARAEALKKLNKELKELAEATKDVLAVGIDQYNMM